MVPHRTAGTILTTFGHVRRAQQLHAERRDLLRTLADAGFSQADIARELGVTRQAIQKMLA
ncbi:MAG TPA: hypothetical protein VKG80_04710 [Trebonia sp.]|nr:hypothetical protein [Trebonia sp.]